ncbi:MAG TPA: T9SS type A sorting domain-containing protein [Fulvivirga sp.]|nr:T9SS type A sorting domain-containing protein [Fulvivirga sp.]
MKKLLSLIVGVLINISVIAQTGPAGVGNFDGSGGEPENIVWLDASTLGYADGASVTTWTDLSGNGNHMVQQGIDNTPLFETNGLFSGTHAAVRFDGSERYLRLDDNADLDAGLSGITIIAVVYNATLDGSPRGIYSKRTSSGSQRSYSAFTYTTQRLNFDIDNGSNQRLASSTGLNTTTDYIISNTYKNSLQQIFLQSSASGSSSFAGNVTNSTSNLILGALNDNYGTYFDGDIAEFIIYRQGLNDGERIIVENYLSQKYGIALTDNNYYGTNPGVFDAAFVNDFMGIGTGNGSDKFGQSGFSDALQIEEANGSLNASNEFVMFAHDNTAHADGVTTNLVVDPGVLDSRWARSWFMEPTGDVSIKLRFDFGTAGLSFSGDANDYVLLYRATTADNYSRLVANSYTVENGDQLVVDLGNTSLPAGYYTIGEGEQLVPGNWYSYQTGDWNDPLTWTTISNGSLREPVTGGVPQPGDNATILSGRTVTMDTDDNDGVNLTVDGKLVIGTTSGHDFFNILGNGTISYAGDVSQNDNFPSGSTAVFADSIVGGTVEIVGTGLNLNQNRLYNNVNINLDNGTDVATMIADFTINGDLTIQQGVLQINDNSTATSRVITAYGNVQIDASGELNVGTANARHEFNFYGDFINQGRAEFTNRVATDYNNEATNGIVDANFLSPFHNQQIDCFGVTNFYRIEIDKGVDQNYILDINASSAANFNLYGPADYGHGSVAQLTTNDNALGLLRGTVRLNLNVDVPVLNNTGNYNISEAARLWVNGGSAAKPAGTAIVPYGTIQMSGGTIDAPINSGITTRANGNVVVSDGIMTVNQIRTSVNGPTNIGGYTQSGGTVNITGNSISTSYYAFSLTYPGNTFNMSGGTLHVAGAPTGANTGGIFIASSTGNQSVTGGTVIMDITRNDDFKVTSLSPFWNVIMRYTSGTGSQVDLIDGASGTGGNVTNITNPDLRVLNDLTIESGVTFDHNGYDVEVGSDFNIENGGEYIYANNRKNTTTINGTDNSLLNFQNRVSTGAGDEQRFWNLVIDKPHNKTVSLASGKPDLTGNNNNLIRVQGDYLKVLGGTLDQGFHSIRLYADTLVNYDVLTVYNPASYNNDNAANGDNDIFKLRDDGSNTVFITADSARFGTIKLNSEDNIAFNSDIKIDYLDYRYGRINIGSNNLKIDFLDERLNNNAVFDVNQNGTLDGGNGVEQKIFSPADMLITTGNASDGGISLLISGNGVYTFPVGIGTDATELLRNNSKYTPAIVTVTNFSDDGYITIRPVDKVLATTDPTGGDVLSYYWKVDYEGFTAVPTVEYDFHYYDDDLDGSGNESSFVAGKVLESTPFTRNYEDDNIPENEGVDDSANTITFNGPSDTGFTLENASYTAGESGRFIGAPTIFYTRRTGTTQNWNSTSSWSTVGVDGAIDGSLPGAGDVVIIGNHAANRIRLNVNINTSAAKLEFEEPSTFMNRLRLYAGTTHDWKTVSGKGEFELVFTNSGNVPTFNSDNDFGVFMSNTESMWNLSQEGTAGLANAVVMPSFPSEFPILRVTTNTSGSNGGTDGWGSQKIVTFANDIQINNELQVFNRAALWVQSNITIENDATIGFAGFGRMRFSNGATSNTVEIKGDLIINGSSTNSSPGNSFVDIQSGGGNGVEHKLIVHGNISMIHDAAYVATLDLYQGGADNNVLLELKGTGNHSLSNVTSSTPDLYRVIVNKGSSKANKFTLDDNINLNGPTNGANKAIKLTNGTLVLNDPAINIDLTTGGANFSISPKTGLQITQGQANVSGDNSGIELDGSLIIDGGTLDMDDAIGNGNNFIEYSASGNAILEISSGTLNVGSQIRPITSANTGVLKYRQTGGDVRVGTQSGPEGTRGMLQIYNVGSEFTYTGGTLTIERHQTSPTISALYLDPDVSDLTGSTITIFNGNTPAGQTDFRINSTIALANLTINGTNSPTAKIAINPLEITNQLSIASGATFNGNGISLTVGGDMDNDGAYNAQNNETVFNSATSQSITGSGTNSFYRFTKSGVGTLNLTNSITVANLFSISDGILDDNGFSINLQADAVIDGTHTSVGGSGLVFVGSANQELRRSGAGTGTLGMITINNSNGVTIPDGNGYNFNIDGGLRLNTGVFNIGGGSLLFGTGADITPVSPFSVSNMIQTNSSFVDSGIGKQFPAGFNQDFTFPVGQAFYTPISFDFGTPGNTFGSTSGTLTVRPANEYHPTINDGTDVLATGDLNNVLQYYWSVEAASINGLIADMTLKYDQSHVLSAEPGATHDEDDYISARILTFNNPSNDINKFDATAVDEVANTIKFNFSGATSNGISGDYFAGLDEAIPNNVATYTAIGGGGDVDQEIYDVPLPSGAGVPPSGAVIVIPSGQTVRLNVDNIRLYKTEIQSGGVLEVDNTTNHRLGTLEGTGTLKIVSDGANANLPAFSGNFLSCSGGGLEYAGTGSYNVLSGITSLRNLTLSGSGNRNFPNNNITICEDLVINGPTLNNSSNRDITILDNLILTSGIFNTGTGDIGISNNLQIDGGVYNGQTGGDLTIEGDFNINGGTFSSGSGRQFVEGDVNYLSGNYEPGSGTHRLILKGNSIQTIRGNFNGLSGIYRLLLNNTSNIQLASADVEIQNILFLNNGKLVTNGNNFTILSSGSISPTEGRSNSYVVGKLSKTIPSGSFTFPIGSASNWRPATVNNVSTGGFTWEAQYFEGDPTTDPLVDNLTPTNSSIKTISAGEYWKISDGSVASSGVTATVGLSWGMESDVSTVSSEREELEVVIWNDGTSSWDNLGGTSFSGSHSQSGGNFSAVTPNTFSEHIFTLGSGDVANPLPITLTSFTGQLVDNEVKLEWTTSSEINNDYFVIERLISGTNNFKVLGQVEGSGSTESINKYQFIDSRPVFGSNVYRLKQVDFDGTATYSDNLVTVNYVDKNAVFSISTYPNPTDQANINLNLSLMGPTPVEISLIDINGKIHYSGVFTPEGNSVEMLLKPTSDLRQGIYIIQVRQGDKTKFKRIIISK